MRFLFVVLLLSLCSVSYAETDPEVFCETDRFIRSPEDIPPECQKGDLIYVASGGSLAGYGDADAYLCDLTQPSMNYQQSTLCVYRGEPRKTRKSLSE